jgi:hypothetical protein
MKSKIKIEYPFTEIYDSAYKVSSQGRNTVVLYKTGTQERTSISYAKYLMSVHLKRWLTKEEHIDHKNNNKLDDRIENYQILSLADNNKKQAALRGCSMIKYECPVCSRIFSVKLQNSHLVGRKNNTSITCSRACGAKASAYKTGIIMLSEYNWYDEHHYTDTPKKAAYFHS